MFSNTTNKLSTALDNITPVELSKRLNSHLDDVREPLEVIYNLISTNYNNIYEQFINKNIVISIEKDRTIKR